MGQANLNLGLQEAPKPIFLEEAAVDRWRSVLDAVADSFNRSPRSMVQGQWAETIGMNEGDLSLALSYEQRYARWVREGKIGKPPQRKNIGEWRLDDILRETQVAAIAQYFAKLAGCKLVPLSDDERRKESERKRKQVELERLREQKAEMMVRIQQLEMEVSQVA